MVIDTSDLTVDQIVSAVLAHLDPRPPDGPARRRRDPRDRPPGGPRAGRGDDPRHTVWYRALRGVVMGVGKTYFRASVTGAEHVPKTGPFILSPIHRSYLDTPGRGPGHPAPVALHGQGVDVEEQVSGPGSSPAAGGFPVKRGTADREALRACQAVLDRGEPLVLFPEGTRGSGPVASAFHDGAAYLSLKTGRPSSPSGWAAPSLPCAKARTWSTRSR